MLRRRWRNAADGELLDACRAGDTEAFSVLWERHRRAALAAAWGIAPSLDAEDLVADAYLKIYQLVVAGRGPRGAFRPYLYQTIRTAAADQLRSSERTTDEPDLLVELTATGPGDDTDFDLDAVRQAFAGLDERWQAALWYTEVEGLPPRKAAPLLGLSPNATAVLTKRAREALRSAWVEAHANRELAEAECRDVLSQLQRFQRGKLTAGASRRVEAHLAGCDSCTAVSADFSEMNRRLGLILAGAILGGVGLGPLLAQLGVGAGSAAAAVGAAGTASVTAGAGAAAGGAAAAATGATTLSVGGSVSAALIGTLSAATVTVGAVALTASAAITPTPPPPAVAPSSAVSAEYPSPTAPTNRRGGSETSKSHRQDQRERPSVTKANRKADSPRKHAKPEKSPQKPRLKDPKVKKPQPAPQPQPQPQPRGPSEKPERAKPAPNPMAADRE